MGAVLGLTIGIVTWLMLSIGGKLIGIEVLSDVVFVGGTL